VAKANATAASEDVADRVRFHVGDAERIPLPDASVDAVVCECAFCTFPDKKTAAEMARVLKPGGRVGITEVRSIPPASTRSGHWPVGSHASLLRRNRRLLAPDGGEGALGGHGVG
jgi:ubiquinone/menaquinone biosynthesis C-methylase UbiE